MPKNPNPRARKRERENARFDEARASVADGNGARFDGSRGVVDGVVVVRDVVVPEHARGLQRAGTTITEKPVMSNEFHTMTRMTYFGTTDADGIRVGCFTRQASKEIAHRKTRVAREFV